MRSRDEIVDNVLRLGPAIDQASGTEATAHITYYEVPRREIRSILPTRRWMLVSSHEAEIERPTVRMFANRKIGLRPQLESKAVTARAREFVAHVRAKQLDDQVHDSLVARLASALEGIVKTVALFQETFLRVLLLDPRYIASRHCKPPEPQISHGSKHSPAWLHYKHRLARSKLDRCNYHTAVGQDDPRTRSKTDGTNCRLGCGSRLSLEK